MLNETTRLAIILALCCVAATGFLAYVYPILKNGRLRRKDGGFATREDNPGVFWFEVISSFAIVFAALIWGAVTLRQLLRIL